MINFVTRAPNNQPLLLRGEFQALLTSSDIANQVICCSKPDWIRHKSEQEMFKTHSQGWVFPHFKALCSLVAPLEPLIITHRCCLGAFEVLLTSSVIAYQLFSCIKRDWIRPKFDKETFKALFKPNRDYFCHLRALNNHPPVLLRGVSGAINKLWHNLPRN